MLLRKFLKVTVLSALMVLTLGSVAHAATWKQESDGVWRFVRKDGGYATDSWAQSGNDWYYMDSDGEITKSSLIDLGNHTYYLKADGVMAKNEWISFDNEETPAEPIWYYFGEDGRAFKGREGRVIPRVIGDRSYAFEPDGRMIRGFITEAGEKVEDTKTNLEFMEGSYYFGEDGAMYKNQWLLYNDVGRDSAYSALAQRPYSEYEELWLYFNEKGKKLTAHNIEKVRVTLINGRNYSFDENGVMIPRLFVTNSSLPASASNATIRYGHEDKSGDNVGDYWTFMVPNEEMDEKDFHEQEFSWFRTNADGKVIKNRIAEVLGRKYAFDGIGRMQTAFVIMYQDGSFAKQFDIDALTKADFLANKDTTLLYGLWRGNLYLFGTDELNDGSMRAGGEISVVLRDGPATFGLRSNGVALGNRFTLERKNNKYYYNGLRLDAGTDIGYAVIKENRSGSDSYVVVDTNGNRIKGKKRVIKDNEGGWILIQNDLFYARVDSGEKPRWKNNNFYYYDSSLRGNARFTAVVARHTGIEADGFEILYNAAVN